MHLSDIVNFHLYIDALHHPFSRQHELGLVWYRSINQEQCFSSSSIVLSGHRGRCMASVARWSKQQFGFSPGSFPWNTAVSGWQGDPGSWTLVFGLLVTLRRGMPESA